MMSECAYIDDITWDINVLEYGDFGGETAIGIDLYVQDGTSLYGIYAMSHC